MDQSYHNLKLLSIVCASPHLLLVPPLPPQKSRASRTLPFCQPGRNLERSETTQPQLLLLYICTSAQGVNTRRTDSFPAASLSPYLMAIIPQELIEVVLAHLDPIQDKQSLKSISLAAHNLGIPAQHILFRSLSIHAGNAHGGENPTFERALNLFTECPHITSYVRELDIRLPWPGQHDVLSRILRLLPRVHRFVIHGCGVPWRILTPALQTALYAFISRPALKKLHLMYISGVPSSFITLAARTVPVMSIQDVVVAPDDIETSESAPRLADLTLSLYFKNPWETLRQLSLTLNIERLALDMDASDDVLDVISTVAPTLKHLELTRIAQLNPGPLLPEAAHLELPHIPNLTTLDVCLPPEAHCLISRACLDALCANLQSPALQALTISTAWPAHGNSSSASASASSLSREDLERLSTRANLEVLSELDDALSTGPSPRFIWDFVCDSKPNSNSTADGEESAYHARVFAQFKTTVEDCMPRMRGRGCLNVRRSVRRGYLDCLP